LYIYYITHTRESSLSCLLMARAALLSSQLSMLASVALVSGTKGFMGGRAIDRDDSWLDALSSSSSSRSLRNKLHYTSTCWRAAQRVVQHAVGLYSIACWHVVNLLQAFDLLWCCTTNSQQIESK